MGWVVVSKQTGQQLLNLTDRTLALRRAQKLHGAGIPCEVKDSYEFRHQSQEQTKTHIKRTYK